MEKLPCINCIILAICRNEYKTIVKELNGVRFMHSHRTSVARNKLTGKYNILGRYLYNDQNKDYRLKKLELHRFMYTELK